MKVVGVDIGSSAIKACTFEFGDGFAPRLLEKFSQPCPLSRPEPGWAEHNLEKMESQLVEVMSRVTTGIPIAFASAMHGLVVRWSIPISPVKEHRSGIRIRELRYEV